MFKNDHVKLKIITFILLNILLSAVFFVISAMPDSGFMFGWHLALVVLWYPTVAAGQRILTDDKAPVELLGIQVIDDLITEELSYYKRILHEDGLGGLMETLMG